MYVGDGRRARAWARARGGNMDQLRRWVPIPALLVKEGAVRVARVGLLWLMDAVVEWGIRRTWVEVGRLGGWG